MDEFIFRTDGDGHFLGFCASCKDRTEDGIIFGGKLYCQECGLEKRDGIIGPPPGSTLLTSDTNCDGDNGRWDNAVRAVEEGR